ncbi:hypothetical protein J6590_041528 [Homalodisca vitripennis]|nr:hypothetical protein J6590_041528 [Homalodisca vitripennis]
MESLTDVYITLPNTIPRAYKMPPDNSLLQCSHLSTFRSTPHLVQDYQTEWNVFKLTVIVLPTTAVTTVCYSADYLIEFIGLSGALSYIGPTAVAEERLFETDVGLSPCLLRHLNQAG